MNVSCMNIHDQIHKKEYPIHENLLPSKKGMRIPGSNTIIKTVKTISTQSV